MKENKRIEMKEYAVTLVEEDRIVAVGNIHQIAGYLGKQENCIRSAVSRGSLFDEKYIIEKV